RVGGSRQKTGLEPGHCCREVRERNWLILLPHADPGSRRRSTRPGRGSSLRETKLGQRTRAAEFPLVAPRPRRIDGAEQSRQPRAPCSTVPRVPTRVAMIADQGSVRAEGELTQSR